MGGEAGGGVRSAGPAKTEPEKAKNRKRGNPSKKKNKNTWKERRKSEAEDG